MKRPCPPEAGGAAPRRLGRCVLVLLLALAAAGDVRAASDRSSRRGGRAEDRGLAGPRLQKACEEVAGHLARIGLKADLIEDASLAGGVDRRKLRARLRSLRRELARLDGEQQALERRFFASGAASPRGTLGARRKLAQVMAAFRREVAILHGKTHRVATRLEPGAEPAPPVATSGPGLDGGARDLVSLSLALAALRRDLARLSEDLQARRAGRREERRRHAGLAWRRQALRRALESVTARMEATARARHLGQTSALRRLRGFIRGLQSELRRADRTLEALERRL